APHSRQWCLRLKTLNFVLHPAIIHVVAFGSGIHGATYFSLTCTSVGETSLSDASLSANTESKAADVTAVPGVCSVSATLERRDTEICRNFRASLFASLRRFTQSSRSLLLL
uniref:Uncharacterized protein n=1 Tax=Parascaris univalens TaxID=6257 RepID=A0A914ZFD9_PARUN